MNLNLKNHVALITGGASGIGAPAPWRSHRNKRKVAIWDRSEAAAKVADEIGHGQPGQSIGLCVDVTDEQAVEHR